MAEKPNLSITVISKKGCHLCEQAIEVLESLKAKYTFDLSILNIEAEPVLFDKYWIKVPVIEANGVNVYEAEDIALLGDCKAKLEKLVSTETLDALH